MIFVGIDWAEARHDVCVLDADGEVLVTSRIPEGLEGVARLHAVVGDQAAEPDEVIVGIERPSASELTVTALRPSQALFPTHQVCWFFFSRSSQR